MSKLKETLQKHGLPATRGNPVFSVRQLVSYLKENRAIVILGGTGYTRHRIDQYGIQSDSLDDEGLPVCLTLDFDDEEGNDTMVYELGGSLYVTDEDGMETRLELAPIIETTEESINLVKANGV